jgi:hypothetical protein
VGVESGRRVEIYVAGLRKPEMPIEFEAIAAKADQ